MEQEANRETASVEHREKCVAKLAVLKEQHIDLSSAIEQLLTDISSGSVKMKTYKQMKMYNDESLNPILYQKKQQMAKKHWSFYTYRFTKCFMFC